MSRLCAYCGGEISEVKRTGTKYCSKSCYFKEYYRDHVFKPSLAEPKYKRECLSCGKEFNTNDQRKKTCSPVCNVKLQNSRRKTGKDKESTCPICKNIFKPINGLRYCSNKCYKKSARKFPEGYAKSKGFDKFRWKGNWFKALERDNFTCQICGKRKDPNEWYNRHDRLAVHHWDGDGATHKKKNHELNNLVTLCDSCHYLFHSKVSILKINGEYFVSGKIFKLLNIKKVKVA